MKKQFLLSIELNKFWLSMIALLIIMIGLFVYFYFLYQDIMENKAEGDPANVEELALDNSDLETIETIERYHGDVVYYVADGETSDGVSQYLFIYKPEAEDEEETEWQYQAFDKEVFYSTEEILTEWSDRCDGCEFLDAAIGMNQAVPILEIKFFNPNQQLVYENVVLEDKSYYRLTLDPTL
ncbi:hypothetical protein [Gracilibacillus alcaliphilus]|uniref:hypothetical protein n=1 Tax=Gracilibacillus alcaliphilus TaxID=1401441 RepID=UPI00195E3EC5|nr:hypothetical protein [Gracilibacillus alcaliphilus]MBM7675218.1 uncharacterized protein YpmB [Gracilibacillus alcaliphilus]